ncbi:MAG: helix-turn-helix transcriptional regulator [Amphritea sp.]
MERGLAACIDTLGSGQFYPRYFQMMKVLARIDQYMVFEFSPTGDQASCRLAHNIQRPELGLQLASLYLDGSYLNDPLLKELREKSLEDPETPACTLLEKRTLPPVYRRRFFNVPDFDEKFAFVITDSTSGHLFYINFYNQHGVGFASSELDGLKRATRLIGSLLLRQFRDERKQRSEVQSLLMAGLSEREAQICGMLLKGHTAKTISQELEVAESTIITYKKRAYNKLGIRRKSELLKII